MRTKSNTPTTPALRNLLAALRDELRDRRQASVSYRNLVRELAAYRRPSEIGDLLAAVDRQSDSPQAEQIRGILARTLADYRRTQLFAS